ncbi:ABC transporter substrate-binding protein [Microbacterium hominis]|uniref:Extracellular solute-binding protein n=1 Tax=Microbacterium hominis TaxID=162426 RepID=A0A7D4QDV1_9MICO|nr:extracellular solute-binding protein [Microbacterium hominis]QKJ20517.1 extracellular solute-binding protein [Microbacterium hominis]
MLTTKRRPAVFAAAGVSALALALAGCSAGGDEGSSDGPVELTFLVDNGEQTTVLFDAIIEAFEAQQDDITVELQTRPPGAEGDNLIKTKLATGEMEDVFFYNSGSLLQAINPDQTLVDLSDQDWVGSLDENFVTTVSTDSGFYGAPGGQSMGGVMLYNKDIYEELGLEIPRTWDAFMANNQEILDSGVAAPVIQTFSDTWSSQLFVLGDFFNVQSVDQDWAEQYTANEAKFADEPALAGFQHLQDVFEAGFLNVDYASATYDDGIRMISTGEGAHYPMLTFAATALAANYPDAAQTVGTFPIPSSVSDANGLTVWMPSALYIPTSTEGAKLDAAKEFLAYMTTPEACEVLSEQVAPTGPFVVDGCELPADVPAIVSDMQPYFDAGDTGLALEFLSPIKGPALEQITVAVGSGISSAEVGAAQYDEDVKKQAQQLGLEGW